MLSAPACITDMNTVQMESLVEALGEPRYRAKQLLVWVYQRLALSFEEMTDLPRPFRRKLAASARLHTLTPAQEVVGSDGTVKTLFSLADSRTIESTLMYYPTAGGGRRCTLCLSTQVGCPVGCSFCATGQQGFERNLTAGEIIDQVLYFSQRLKKQPADPEGGPAITNIVFMGMGEPLANYEALLQSIEMLNSPDAFGLGARNMVVSTSGMVPEIQRLGREKLQVGLAVSLHASDNALRNKLVPLNWKYPLEQLLPACRQYYRDTGRRISFEYALFEGVNDSLPQARALAHLLTGLHCHVNLIAANRTNDVFRPPLKQAVLAFENELKRLHVTCTLRESRGRDIDAGCGQLQSRFQQGGKKKK